MSPYPVSDFLQWNGADQLVITPKFQRRDVWNPKAKSYLIDTILRRMPIPPIFLRLRTHTNPPRTLREVVDGQQRLRSVLGYIAGTFPILGVHNPDYADRYFDDLPEDAKEEILSYKFQVNTLENISDAEVLRIFARLNTYTEKLTAQELLNAEFFGAFKNAIYDISLRYYTFWTTKRIFSDAKIARMAEAEFTSELVISAVSGIRQTKSAQIRAAYREFDDAFPQAGEVSARFDRVINIINDAFGEELPRSPFRRLPLFYSLFLAIYDRQFGLPIAVVDNQQPQARPQQPQAVRPAVLGRNLRALQAEMQAPALGSPVARFVEDSARATADPGKRRSRHAFLMERLFVA
ncbi:MAG: hypothetical protein QOJ27_2394 [Sphingomonadales bacterium]|nr:hypothetical protein [Sphingomonadales bacterium]